MSNKEHQRLDILATVSGVMIALHARANSSRRLCHVCLFELIRTTGPFLLITINKLDSHPA